MGKTKMILTLLLVLSLIRADCTYSFLPRECTCCLQKFFHDGSIHTAHNSFNYSLANIPSKWCSFDIFGIYFPEAYRYSPAVNGNNLGRQGYPALITATQRGKNYFYDLEISPYNSEKYSIMQSTLDGKLGNIDLKNDECYFITSRIDIGNFENNPIDTDFDKLRAVDSVSPISCRYMKCVNDIKDESSPFCTNSGYYETKDLYCKAFADFKDVSASTGCPEIRYG